MKKNGVNSMATENKPTTGTEPAFLWAFSRKIPKSQLARIPLDLEPPETVSDPPDQFDDDYWRWSYYRRPKLVGWLDIEEFSKRLKQQVDDEYAARQRHACRRDCYRRRAPGATA